MTIHVCIWWPVEFQGLFGRSLWFYKKWKCLISEFFGEMLLRTVWLFEKKRVWRNSSRPLEENVLPGFWRQWWHHLLGVEVVGPLGLAGAAFLALVMLRAAIEGPVTWSERSLGWRGLQERLSRWRWAVTVGVEVVIPLGLAWVAFSTLVMLRAAIEGLVTWSERSLGWRGL